MRPPEFTGGNLVPVPAPRSWYTHASMRPPEFTGGNNQVGGSIFGFVHHASMRPPEFTGGNRHDEPVARDSKGRFNEAAGIHRRKLQIGSDLVALGVLLQ